MARRQAYMTQVKADRAQAISQGYGEVKESAEELGAESSAPLLRAPHLETARASAARGWHRLWQRGAAGTCA